MEVVTFRGGSWTILELFRWTGLALNSLPLVLVYKIPQFKPGLWGEWVDDYRTFLTEKPELNILEYVAG